MATYLSETYLILRRHQKKKVKAQFCASEKIEYQKKKKIRTSKKKKPINVEENRCNERELEKID